MGEKSENIRIDDALCPPVKHDTGELIDKRRKEISGMVKADSYNKKISILNHEFSPIDALELTRRIQDALFDVQTKIILIGGSPDGE